MCYNGYVVGVCVQDPDIPRKLLHLQTPLYSRDCIHQTHMTGKTYETRVGNRRNLMLPLKFRYDINTHILCPIILNEQRIPCFYVTATCRKRPGNTTEFLTNVRLRAANLVFNFATMQWEVQQLVAWVKEIFKISCFVKIKVGC